jgi:hypothetical protein
LFTTLLGLLAVSTAGCAEKTPSTAAATTAVSANADPAAAEPVAAAPEVAAAKWNDIKDLSYDARGQFFSGLTRLEARLDAQIAELAARRAAMKASADTKDWDFATKELGNARTNLKSTGEDLSKATPDIWDQLKDKVGRAWLRAQAAYDKVKASTTS